MIHLVLGGARSGKSNFAEQYCIELSTRNTNQSLFYVATATAFDAEMDDRILHHQQSRAEQWKLIECPLALCEQLNNVSSNIYLIDCLTLWLNNIIFSLEKKLSKAEKQQQLQIHIDQLTNATFEASTQGATIVLVANEVGLGVIPMGEDTRYFVDYAGWLNQAIARIANKVTLITAGIPLTLKDELND